MKLIDYSPQYANRLTDVFYHSVHAIDIVIYSTEQKNAWAPLPIDYEKWAQRFNQKKPTILIVNESVAGFIELEHDGHIDCLYVEPSFERKGIATKLLNHAIATAQKSGITFLFVEASIVAKPLFEKLGFITERKNVVYRNKVRLINYSMRFQLN